jgi:hypothetical protein
VIPAGLELAVGRGNSAMAWALGLISPIRLLDDPVNHRLPSGPAVIRKAWLGEVGIGNSLMVTDSRHRDSRLST